ncbi:hypothetical protein BGZ83_009269 [Gryganskiella cystojenkinii]|nr:hypothetical protein BGZ83_009269 [Gryganskiella cystojenkinii]
MATTPTTSEQDLTGEPLLTDVVTISSKALELCQNFNKTYHDRISTPSESKTDEKVEKIEKVEMVEKVEEVEKVKKVEKVENEHLVHSGKMNGAQDTDDLWIIGAETVAILDNLSLKKVPSLEEDGVKPLEESCKLLFRRLL